VISHLVILVIVVLTLGASPAAAGKRPPSLTELKQAVAANPQSPQAHYSLGLKYESLGKTKKALGEYQKALSLKPDDEKVLFSLARLMGTLGQPGSAIAILNKAVKLKPDFAEARSLLAVEYNSQGVALLEQGNLDDAREAFEAGIKANGGAAETEALRNNLGCLYVRENRLEEAADTFRDVLRQNQDVAQAHYNLALIYYTQGDYQAASQEFYALKGVNPDLAAELSSYRFRVETSTYVTPPVKTMVTFPGSPLLTEGTVLPSYAR
jgi:tetratricopeptide (TPR) repeat protein